MNWLGINPAGAKLLEMIAVYVNMNKYGYVSDKDMLMTKLSMSIFESLSICCLYQKRLVETICYSEMVKPNILLRKLKQRKKKRKKERSVGVRPV